MDTRAADIFLDHLVPWHALLFCRVWPRASVRVHYMAVARQSRPFLAPIVRLLAGLRRVSGGWIQPPQLIAVSSRDDQLPDLANIHADTFTLTTEMLDRYRRRTARPQTGVTAWLDDDAARSYEARMLGGRLRPLVLALLSLRAASVRIDVGLIRNPDIPDPIVSMLSEALAIPLRKVRSLPDPLIAITLPMAALSLVRPARSARREAAAWVRHEGSIDVVHELVDPDLRPGAPTSPAHIMQGDAPVRILFYVLEAQERRFRLDRSKWLACAPHVVFLSDGVFAQSGSRWTYARALWGLVRQGLASHLSGSGVREGAREIRLYLALESLFRMVRPRASLHTSFPHGRSGLHFHAGIITSLARRHGVRSIGYQTRATYLRTYEELFECYDVWCAWGKAWADTAMEYGYLKESRIVGDVSLDECRDRLPSLQAARPDEADRPVEVVLFLASLAYNDDKTLGYLRGTVVATLRAAGRAGKKTRRSYRVWLKVKDIADAPLYENDGELKNIAGEEGVPLACLRADRHDVVDQIAFADLVVSIGFTTPGVDALLMGKPSFYFTVLKDVHPAFARAPDFVLRDANDLARCLAEFTRLPPDQLDRYDCYRDGNAIQRVMAISLHVGTGPCSGEKLATAAATLRMQ